MSRYVDLDRIEFIKADGNEEFNHGVVSCINRLLRAEPIKAVSLDKVKQTREEIQKLVDMCGSDTVADLNMKSGLGLALEKIDKLIEIKNEQE